MMISVNHLLFTQMDIPVELDDEINYELYIREQKWNFMMKSLSVTKV